VKAQAERRLFTASSWRLTVFAARLILVTFSLTEKWSRPSFSRTESWL